MDIYGWCELALFILLLTLLTKPMGIYLKKVLDPSEATFLDRVLKPVENAIYRVAGLDPLKEQDWKRYAFSLIAFSFVSLLFTYAVLRIQNVLPLNPQGFGPVKPDLAFNTAVSFTTNTNWQNYAGESTLSYFSQMVGLTLHNFTSAGTGIAVAAALVRGISRRTAQTIGNFWTDLVRSILYLLLPLSLIFAVFLVSQGVIDNFHPYVTVPAVGDPTTSYNIAQGPLASQDAIKILGTNGGGFMNANAAHPFENPTPLSGFVMVLSIFLIPSALTYYLGLMVGNKKHGWAVWKSMMIVFLLGVLVCWWAESAGNPRIAALGVDRAQGNMEGKEARLGVFDSTLFATVTTDASCGAVNSMHDSFTPLGGLVPLLNIELGEIIFGGVGSGLYGMLVFVILTVFLAGLMVGRTPEYLGKKIESYDVKAAVISVLILTFSILGFTAWGGISGWGKAGLNNAGPHGFSEILYAFSSCVGNNGSAFAGLNANTPWYNTTLALAMFFGRFLFIVPVLALAGNLAKKKAIPPSSGTFPVWGFTFIALLTGVVLIVGALTFLPALSMGPILEHFMMLFSNVLF